MGDSNFCVFDNKWTHTYHMELITNGLYLWAHKGPIPRERYVGDHSIHEEVSWIKVFCLLENRDRESA